MKKIIFSFVFFGIVIFANAQNAVTLDEALRSATAYLNTRLQRGSKVVVLNFTSNWESLSEYIIEELMENIVNDGTLTVVDRRNIEQIRQELNFQLSGDVSDETAQSIGQMLGAQSIISGSITALGGNYRFRVRAISVETAQILGMQSSDVRHESRIAALTGTAHNASPTPSVAASSISAPTVAASAAQSNFFPLSSISQNNFNLFTDSSVGGRSTINARITREAIDGAERDVITIEAVINRNPASGAEYANLAINENSLNERLRSGNGIRFKVQGDGRAWILYIQTQEASVDHNYYEYTFTPRNNRITTVDIPFSRLRQPAWGNRVTFNRNSIIGIQFGRQSRGNTFNSSSIKIFDIEVY